MSEGQFKSALHDAFKFLCNDFSLSVIEERYGEGMGNGFAMFAKNGALIQIAKDRGQLLILLGDEGLSTREWVEFAEAVKYFSKSTDPMYIFPSDDNPVSDESQLPHLAQLMLSHCNPILSGTMSVMQLREAIVAQPRAETRRFLNAGGWPTVNFCKIYWLTVLHKNLVA
jgi:hypothetical protein